MRTQVILAWENLEDEAPTMTCRGTTDTFNGATAGARGITKAGVELLPNFFWLIVGAALRRAGKLQGDDIKRLPLWRDRYPDAAGAWSNARSKLEALESGAPSIVRRVGSRQACSWNGAYVPTFVVNGVEQASDNVTFDEVFGPPPAPPPGPLERTKLQQMGGVAFALHKGLVGRDDVRAKLARWLLVDAPNPVALVGPSGSGKTALLVDLVRGLDPMNLANDQRPIVGVACEKNKSPVAELISAAQQALGGPATAAPSDGRARVVALIELLRPHRAIVVLDDAQHASGPHQEEIQALVRACGSPGQGIRLVVSSWNAVPGIDLDRTLELTDEVAPEVALGIVRQRLSGEIPEPLIDLVKRVPPLPIVLVALAEAFKANPAVRAGDGSRDPRLTTADEKLAAMLEHQAGALSADERRVMLALGCLAKPVADHELATIAGVGVDVVKATIARLGWPLGALHERRAKALREGKVSALPNGERVNLHLRAAAVYRALQDKAREEKRDGAEIDHALDRFRQLRHAGTLDKTHLAAALDVIKRIQDRLLSPAGRFSDALALRQSVAADLDPHSREAVENVVAMTIPLARLGQARWAIQQLEGLERELARLEDPTLLELARNNLGVAWWNRRHVKTALKWYRAAREIAREHGFTAQFGIRSANISEALLALGRVRAAAEAAEDARRGALDLERAANALPPGDARDDKLHAARKQRGAALFATGFAALHGGRVDEAIADLSLAAHIAESVVKDERRVVLRLWRLGEAFRLKGELQTAREHLAKAAQIAARHAENADASLLGRLGASLGLVLHLMGEAGGAHLAYRRAISAGRKQPTVVPWAQLFRALLALEEGDPTDAARWAESARKMAARAPHLVEEAVVGALACVLLQRKVGRAAFDRLRDDGCAYLAHDARLVLDRLAACSKCHRVEVAALTAVLEGPRVRAGESSRSPGKRTAAARTMPSRTRRSSR